MVSNSKACGWQSQLLTQLDGQKLSQSFLNSLSNCLEGGREQVPGPGRSKVAHTDNKFPLRVSCSQGNNSNEDLDWTAAVLSGDRDIKTEGAKAAQKVQLESTEGFFHTHKFSDTQTIVSVSLKHTWTDVKLLHLLMKKVNRSFSLARLWPLLSQVVSNEHLPAKALLILSLHNALNSHIFVLFCPLTLL